MVGTLVLFFIFAGIGSSAVAATAEPLEPDTLAELLPQPLPGWAYSGDPLAGLDDTDGVAWSFASQYYTDGETQLVIMIEDSTSALVGDLALLVTNIGPLVTTGAVSETTVMGYPAWEQYDEDMDGYVLYVSVDDRFMIGISAIGGDTAMLYSHANAVDYAGILDAAYPPAAAAEDTGLFGLPGFELIFALAALVVAALLVRR